MAESNSNPRAAECDVDAMFTDRWSPRAFSDEPISQRQIDALFEAARWTPSCYNDQPWLFVYASSPQERAKFADALWEKNRQWAQRAPLLIFLAARRNFSATGKPNRHATFDAGAAWMSLALQARKLGLYAHAMAGFDQDKAHDAAALDKQQYEIMAAIAVGFKGNADSLPEELKQIESPNARKPHTEVARELKS